MRKSKEERIIDHGTEILEELQRVYLEGIGIDEYYKLLSEYKKLNRRYEKVIKLSDNMGNEIMEQNDSLNDNLQYTIKTARSKLLENVTEHRKTKDASSQYKETIKKYEEALNESYSKNAKIQKKLNSYIKHFGEINHNFNKEVNYSNNQSKKMDMNPIEYKNMDIKQVISYELSKGKEQFVLSKIKLNNFQDMLEVIEKNSSMENFINGTYKYIKNCFNKDDVIFHDEIETFYIITKNQKTSNVSELMEKLNKKRKVFNFPIKFSIGMTEYLVERDTEEILLRRCENAFLESIETNQIVIK